MPNLMGDTVLTEAITLASPDMQSFEFRKPEAGIIQAFNQGTNQLVSAAEMERLRTSATRPVSIALPIRKAVRVGDVRKLNPAPDRLASKKFALSWRTIEFSIAVTPAAGVNNVIPTARELATLLNEAIWNAVVINNTYGLEAFLAGYLQSKKWAVPPASRVRGVSVANGAYTMISEDLPVKAPTVMKELQIAGPFIDIANTASLARQNEMKMYGRNNQKNIEQFLNYADYFYSDRLVPAVTAEEIHYLVPRNGLGLLNWIEIDGQRQEDAINGYMRRITDPVFGFEWAVRVVEEFADQTADYGVGAERMKQIRYDFAADFAPVNQYSSVPGESSIVRFDTLVAA